MVGTHYRTQDFRRAHIRNKRIVYALVINAPPDIFFARVKTVTPPRVLVRLGAKSPERIAVAIRRKLRHPVPLFRQVTGVFLIRFRIGKIDWLMRNVVVAV